MGATGVLVVGAGPAGLTMWRTFSTGRASVTGSSRRRPVEESRALVVYAKTLELLARLDLADRAVDEDQRMGAVALFSESKPAGRSSFLDEGADDRMPYPFALVLEQI